VRGRNGWCAARCITARAGGTCCNVSEDVARSQAGHGGGGDLLDSANEHAKVFLLLLLHSQMPAHAFTHARRQRLAACSTHATRARRCEQASHAARPLWRGQSAALIGACSSVADPSAFASFDSRWYSKSHLTQRTHADGAATRGRLQRRSTGGAPMRRTR
jgi:hypothetical protein